MKQPFEKYPKLADNLLKIGNGKHLSGHEWTELLEEINKLCIAIEKLSTPILIQGEPLRNI